jgi:hypothetical protein
MRQAWQWSFGGIMSNSVNTRHIAEHLCTLASLLEAEALRSKAFGAPHAKDISRHALEVRTMANQLWDADIMLPLAPSPMHKAHHVGRIAAAAAAAQHACDSEPVQPVGRVLERLVF